MTMVWRLGLGLLLGLLLGLPKAVMAQDAAGDGVDDQVVKTVCMSALGYETAEPLKAELLLRAKREAANELFGGLIVATTTVQDWIVTEYQLRI